MKTVQFSVVIPLYNKRDSICAALESVRQQHFAAAEIIVVDDGSTDDSAAQVEAMALPNVKLVKQTNQGVSAARNHGVKLAKHAYVAFLDADDRWTPFFLHEISRLIARYPNYGLYATRYQKQLTESQFIDAKIALTDMRPNGYPMKNYFAIAGQGDLPFMVSSSVVCRSYFLTSGGFPKGEWMGEDQSFFAQAALDEEIVYSPQIRLLYSVAAENRASDKLPPTKPCPFATRLSHQLRSGQIPAAIEQDVKTYIAAHLCDLAKRNVQASQFDSALKLLARPNCQHKPLHRLYWASQARLMAVLNTQSKTSATPGAHA